MGIPDRGIGWKSKREFIPANTMTGVLSSAGVNAQQGAGGAVHAAHSVGASELTVYQVGADGDEFYHFWPIPWDYDRNYNLRFRPIYSDSTTSGVATTWKLSYMGVAKGEAIADISSNETISIDHTNSIIANAVEVPNWTATVSGTSNITSTDYAIVFRLECDTMGTGMAAGELELFGFEVEYLINATRDIKQDPGSFDTSQ